MSLRLPELLDRLDAFAELVPLQYLTRWLDQLHLDLDEVQSCLRFASGTYQRNPLRFGTGYHALVLCWRNGQRSPIHDHRGSSCAVRVLSGVATETHFECGPNGL